LKEVVIVDIELVVSYILAKGKPFVHNLVETFSPSFECPSSILLENNLKYALLIIVLK